MSVLIDPSHFLSDPEVRPFVFDKRIDLADPNVPIVATGKFICASIKVPRGQIYVVKAVIPYAMERINMPAANETAQFLNPRECDGFFLFEPLVNDSSPFVMELDYNAMSIDGAAYNNNDRVRGKGISYVSAEPWKAAQNAWFNPLFTFTVSSDATLRVIFSILGVASIGGIPAGGQFAVAGAGGARRVDFAGCMVVGQMMSEQYYRGLVQQHGNRIKL